jgi:hypothetical protein
MLIAPWMQKKHGWDPELQKKKTLVQMLLAPWMQKKHKSFKHTMGPLWLHIGPSD